MARPFGLVNDNPVSSIDPVFEKYLGKCVRTHRRRETPAA
jgi:hypothetical protein